VSRLGAQATHLSGLGVEKILAVGGLSGGCRGLGPRGGLLGRVGHQRGGRGGAVGRKRRRRRQQSRRRLCPGRWCRGCAQGRGGWPSGSGRVPERRPGERRGRRCRQRGRLGCIRSVDICHSPCGSGSAIEGGGSRGASGFPAASNLTRC